MPPAESRGGLAVTNADRLAPSPWRGNDAWHSASIVIPRTAIGLDDNSAERPSDVPDYRIALGPRGGNVTERG